MASPDFCWQMYKAHGVDLKIRQGDPMIMVEPSRPYRMIRKQRFLANCWAVGGRWLLRVGQSLFSDCFRWVTVIKLWLLPSRLVIPTTDSTALETTRKEQFNVSQTNGYSDNSMDIQGRQMEFQTNVTIFAFLGQPTSSFCTFLEYWIKIFSHLEAWS